MPKRIKLSLMLCFVSALLTFLCPFRTRAAADLVEITGIILVVNLFEDYDMAAVMISGDDGEMYAVSNNDRGTDLLRHENQTVKVIGTVAINENGGKTLTVERYIILEGYLKNSFNVESRRSLF